MLLNQEISHKYDEELFLRNLFHVDLHYRISPITKIQRIESQNRKLVIPRLLVKRIFDRCISFQYLVENQSILKILEKIHRQFAYVAMMLLMLVLHLQHLFHL